MQMMKVSNSILARLLFSTFARPVFGETVYSANTPISVITDASAIKAAHYVIDSLKEINDSGIYAESLSLHSILAASMVEGIYHNNTVLTIQLASEYFYSGNKTESFEVIVMDSFIQDYGETDDGKRNRRGYAIDRFPKMNEEEIEKASWRKVDKVVRENKKMRAEILRWE